MNQDNNKNIDLSKITPGEIIRDNKVYDVDGNYLRPVPIKDEPIVTRIDESKIKEGDTIFMGILTSSDGKPKGLVPHIDVRATELEEFETELEKLKKAQTLNIISFSGLMHKAFKENSWIVEGLIPSEGSIAISGSPASFKTWLILDMAIKIAEGNLLFGKFKTKQSAVLIIDEESGHRLIQERMKSLSSNFELPIYFSSLENFTLSESKIKTVIDIAKNKGIELVIFDSLVRIHGTDENDATKMAGIFKHIKELNKSGLTVIFTHHNRKQGVNKSDPSQSMRGSSDILAYVDCHVGIERKNREESIDVIQTKNRFVSEIKPFTLNILNDGRKFQFVYAGEVKKKEQDPKETENAILNILEKLHTAGVNEIYEATDKKIGIVRIRKTLKKMTFDGLIESYTKDHNKEVFQQKKP